jgi:hypothetical protein
MRVKCACVVGRLFARMGTRSQGGRGGVPNGFVQQRPLMTKQELEEQISEIMLEVFVPASGKAPDVAMLRKVDLAARRIIALIEENTH